MLFVSCGWVSARCEFICRYELHNHSTISLAPSSIAAVYKRLIVLIEISFHTNNHEIFKNIFNKFHNNNRMNVVEIWRKFHIVLPITASDLGRGTTPEWKLWVAHHKQFHAIVIYERQEPTAETAADGTFAHLLSEIVKWIVFVILSCWVQSTAIIPVTCTTSVNFWVLLIMLGERFTAFRLRKLI